MHQPLRSYANQESMWAKTLQQCIFIIIWETRLTSKLRRWRTLALFKELPSVSHSWLYLSQSVWFSNPLASFAIPLSSLMMLPLALLSNMVLFSSMPPPPEYLDQPSISFIPTQATHLYSSPYQNARQYLLSNIFSVFLVLLVTRALSSVLMKVGIFPDHPISLFPDGIYTWLSKL